MMRITSNAGRAVLAVVVLAAGAATAWASGATFAVTGQGITLSAAPEGEEGGMPSRFSARAEVGKPFTLIAQGIVLPRGGKLQPAEPDAGTWSFDEARFRRLSAAGQPADKTKVVIRLEPAAPGTARVRFAGKILGYDRTVEVLVEVVAPKKE